MSEKQPRKEPASMKKRKEKEYLVLVIDTVSKYVRIKAKSKKGAEQKIFNGDWFDEDVEKEDVVDRQFEGVQEE
jgi:hypothetical protein